MLGTLRNILSALASGYVSGAMATLPIGPTGVESIRRHLRHGLIGGLSPSRTSSSMLECADLESNPTLLSTVFSDSAY